jgi:putative FmdB family regulatory protein
MPTYQYRCTKCAHEFEEFQLITEDPLDTCPRCGGKPQRVITGGGGLIFKGKGFYITDYRSESYKKDASKDKPPSKATKTDSGKKSESGTKPKSSGD